MIKYFITLLICLYVFTCVGADPQTQFEQANKTYRSGNYIKAIELYEQILKEKHRSAELYFNLGNAYYKQEEYAKAILNFERGRKMDPQNDDILFNLKMANLNTVDKIEPIPQLFYERWWESYVNTFDADGWAQIAVILLWTSLGFATLYIFAGSIVMKKTWFMSAFAGLFFYIFLMIVSHSADKQLNSNNAAIIINASAYVKSSPDGKSTNLFMLHAGTRIEILDQLQNWKKIKIANGNVGWINKEAVEII